MGYDVIVMACLCANKDACTQVHVQNFIIVPGPC